MIIYPSIDLKEGKCVRLTQGDFSKVTTYTRDPKDVARVLMDSGARWLHVVDLDGAKEGKIMQMDLIAEIAGIFTGRVQVGGGVRSEDDITQLLNAGISRVIIGSACVHNPKDVSQWITTFGQEKIGLALDFRKVNGIPYIATQGWQQDSQKTVWDVLLEINNAKYIICTDIGLDGMAQGPSTKLYAEFVQRFPELCLLASGGVSDKYDIDQLSSLGISGCIIGKAFYENEAMMREVINC